MDGLRVTFLQDDANRGLVHVRRASLAAVGYLNCVARSADLFPSVVLRLNPLLSEHGEPTDKCNPEIFRVTF